MKLLDEVKVKLWRIMRKGSVPKSRKHETQLKDWETAIPRQPSEDTSLHMILIGTPNHENEMPTVKVTYIKYI